MAAMPPMPAVMEQVHQRTGQQEQVGQHAEQVGAVLGEQEERGDCGEADEHPFRARRSRLRLFVPVPGFMRLVHIVLPIQMAARRSRRALVTTEAELKLIASAAMRGESSRPKKG